MGTCCLPPTCCSTQHWGAYPSPALCLPSLATFGCCFFLLIYPTLKNSDVEFSCRSAGGWWEVGKGIRRGHSKHAQEICSSCLQGTYPGSQGTSTACLLQCLPFTNQGREMPSRQKSDWCRFPGAHRRNDSQGFVHPWSYNHVSERERGWSYLQMMSQSKEQRLYIPPTPSQRAVTLCSPTSPAVCAWLLWDPSTPIDGP